MYTQKGFQAHGKRTTANGAMEGESPGKMYGKSPAKLIDDENSLKETNSANLVTNQSSFAATKSTDALAPNATFARAATATQPTNAAVSFGQARVANTNASGGTTPQVRMSSGSTSSEMSGDQKSAQAVKTNAFTKSKNLKSALMNKGADKGGGDAVASSNQIKTNNTTSQFKPTKNKFTSTNNAAYTSGVNLRS
jgi:hypothetical protein|tara:strand:+ start:487 stop:1071 length:585 start_codon:yes stop_codon:yes gene_type:complete